MGFNDFEKAALIGAAAAGLVSGEQADVDKTKPMVESSASEQVVLTPRQKTEIQKDADGREYLMINGAKAYLEPERVSMKVEAPIIESKSKVVLTTPEKDDGKDKIEVASIE